MYLLILLCTMNMLEVAIHRLELETVCVCVSELMEKDFIYTKVFFRCVLVDLILYHLSA